MSPAFAPWMPQKPPVARPDAHPRPETPAQAEKRRWMAFLETLNTNTKGTRP